MTAQSSSPGLVVGAAILDDPLHPTHLYVAQRAYPQALAGLWEFPGGKLEPGESPRPGLQRECAEELGVIIRVLDEVPALTENGWPLDNGAFMRVFTAAVAHGGYPMHQEGHMAARWMPLNQPQALLGLAWIPADLPIVDALLRQLHVLN